MVKKLGWFFAYFFFFLAALAVFTPKENIYFLFEQKIKPYGVVLDAEKLNDTGFSLHVSDAALYFQGIKAAKIKAASITFFGFYNIIAVQDVTLDELSDGFFPKDIKNIHASYNLLQPLHVTIDAKGGFGEIHGSIDLLSRKLQINLKPSKEMLQKYRAGLREFKKSANGEYVYEKTL